MSNIQRYNHYAGCDHCGIGEMESAQDGCYVIEERSKNEPE